MFVIFLYIIFKRIQHTLDAKYTKADLQKEVKQLTNLTDKQQQALLELLQTYEPLFDGTLGEWKLEPVSLELKPDAKPYHA